MLLILIPCKNQDAIKWKKPLGFYLARGLGHQFWRRDNIQIVPVVKTGGDEIMGITLDLQGLEFALLVGDHDVTGTGLDKAPLQAWRPCFPHGRDCT
ncbi:hypothetical protein [Bradyrhizobium canariense]|uniref:Uncharacterized protein n=1 Tax=Bradyrhizobium canariense TaxID=255045 RepID=A0A1H1XQ55_9BRAD|nr:hypothetical protein [Bradyrhizobium canariense]SDT11343.1 hypothetical protein SAMN05444158_4434 [Bradyrhizobium canariense]